MAVLDPFIGLTTDLLLIARLGDEALEHLALLIDCAPEVHHLTVNLHVHLVEVPTPVTKAVHPTYPLATDVAGKHRDEPIP